MEKKFISNDILTYRVWNELKPLITKNDIKIVKEEEGKKYIYVEYLVNFEEYELINRLTKKKKKKKVEYMLICQAYLSIIISKEKQI